MSGEMTSLLLVGRPGHGKSSTGNSILGEKIFQPKFADSQSDGLDKAIREVNGREVQVVDVTGLADNDQEFPENADHFIDLAKKAIELIPQTGYSAIVLVLKYGIRFTKQEVVAVQMIKSLFGPGVIQRHGIIVMTCGDQFERDMEDESLSFQQWCGQQEGEVKQLMKECGQRCVLFDNKTKESDRQSQQVQQLMETVNQVKGQAGPYTKTNFEDAESGRKKLLDMANVPQFDKKLEDISQELKQIKGHDQDRQSEELAVLQEKLAQIETVLQGMDKNVGPVSRLVHNLDSTKNRVKLLCGIKGVIQTQPSHSDTHVNIPPSTAAAKNQVDNDPTAETCVNICYCCRSSSFQPLNVQESGEE